MDGPPPPPPGPPLPNPVVYLNYLDPRGAFYYEVARNVYLATLGAFIWDILSCLQQDWKLLRISKPQPVFFAYHLSRLGALLLLILFVLGLTGPIKNCQTVEIAGTACGFVSFISSDFLFLARVCAVYYHKRTIRIAFIVLWIIHIAVLFLIFLGLNSIPIANTRHCIEIGRGSKYAVVPQLASLVFDTMVYVFITARLLSTRKSNRQKMTWWSIFSGESLPKLSYAIMQGGQQYYLIKVVSGVINATFWLIPSIPVVCRIASSIPVSALSSSMACRVYRQLKLDSTEEEQRTLKSTADAVFTTRVQVEPLTEMLTIKDVEVTTNGCGPAQIVESDVV